MPPASLPAANRLVTQVTRPSAPPPEADPDKGGVPGGEIQEATQTWELARRTASISAGTAGGRLQ